MDYVVEESGYSADATNTTADDHVESMVTRSTETTTGNLRSEEEEEEEEEPSARIPSGTGQRPKRDRRMISLSAGSQFSNESFETALEPRVSDINDRVSEASSLNDQSVPGDCKPDDTALSSAVNKQDQPHRVSDVARESMSVSSTTKIPPLQVMDRRSGRYVPGRISSSLFATNSTPRDRWSVASNESLFSLHVGHFNFNYNGAWVMGAPSSKFSDFTISGELTSHRPSTVGGQERTKSAVDKGRGHAGPASMTDNNAQDLIVQNNIHEHIDAQQAHIPEMSRQNQGKIKPLPPPLAIKKPETPSSCCKKLSCCCSSLSCCCSSLDFCCSRPSCRCCKMPSCSCSNNYTLGWCCNWNCCSKKTCCSEWSCCPKGSCCPSCSNCSKAVCCWKWSCWKLFRYWNCNCFSKGSCCRSWSCCCKGACCESWSRCSEESCYSMRKKLYASLKCCSKGTYWNCCTERSCCRSWNCFSGGTCCGSWNCCLNKGPCCKSWSCCRWGSCCNDCTSGSCCPAWNCCSTRICSSSLECCCTTGECCCCFKSFRLKMCCFSSTTK